MADIKPISAEGSVDIINTIIYETPTNSTAEISSITISNDQVDYIIEVRKWTSQSSNRLLFRYELDAGDIHTHGERVRLRAGQYITATSSVPTTEFIIEGIETFEVK